MTVLRYRYLVLAAVLVFLSVSASAAVGPDINVNNIEPTNPRPGDTVKVTLTVANNGNQESSFSYVDTQTTEGIEFTGTTSGFEESFNLCGGCQRIGTIYLRVDESAKTGTYPVDFVISAGGRKFKQKAELEVEGNPKLVVKTKETHLVPGVYKDLSITVKNIGTGRASETVLDQDEEMFSLNPQTIEFGDIDPGESVTRSARIIADEDMESGVKNLKSTLEYRHNSNKTSKKVKIPLVIDNLANLVIGTLESGTAVIGEPTTVTMELENLGPGEAEKISSRITCEGAEVLAGKSFVGQLDDDESVPTVFKIRPNTSNVKCSVDTSYEDRTARTFSEEININAKASSNLLYYITIFVILTGVGIYYWRRKRQDELSEI